MHSSCYLHDEYFCGMCLQQSYRVLRWCVEFYTILVHDVVFLDMFCRTYLFWNSTSFLGWSVHHPFFDWSGHCASVWPSFFGLAFVRCPMDAFHVVIENEFHVAVHIFPYFCGPHDCNILYDAIHMIVLFCRSRVQALDQTELYFYGSGVQFPGLVACVRPVISVAYVTHPHDQNIRLACGKIQPPWRKSY